MPHNQEQLDPQVPSHYYEFMNVQRYMLLVIHLFFGILSDVTYIQGQVVDLRREIALEQDHQLL